MLKAVTRQANLVDAKIQHLNRALPSRPFTSLNEVVDKGEEENQGMSTAYFFDHHAEPSDLAVMVTEEDFLAAKDELVPSVSQGELAHYEKVRAAFEGTKDAPALPPASTRQERRGVDVKGKGKMPAYVDEEQDGGGAGTVRRKDKGKGKAVMGFQDGTASDDEGLY